MMDNTTRAYTYAGTNGTGGRTPKQARRMRQKAARDVRQADAARRESTAVMRAAMAPPTVGIDPGEPVGVYLNRDPAGDALSAEVLAAALRPAYPDTSEWRLVVDDCPARAYMRQPRHRESPPIVPFEDVT